MLSPFQVLSLKTTAAGVQAMAPCTEARAQAFTAFALGIPGYYRESLHQLVHGPVWDGDVISKSLRDDLIEWGLAVRICVKGEQGYTSATNFGYSVHKFQEGNL